MDGNKSMYEAAREGDLHSLKLCVEKLSKDEARRLTTVANERCATPLVVACRQGHVEVVEYLIDQCGADVELKWGPMALEVSTPLWWATAFQHLNVVKCLLSRGANVNSVNRECGQTAMFAACWHGDVEMAKHLIASGADIEPGFEDEETYLSIACYRKHYPLAMYLIQEDVNGRSILKNLSLLAEMFTEMMSKGESVDFEVIRAVFVWAVDDVEAKIKWGGYSNEIFEEAMVLRLIGCMARKKAELSEEQNKSLGEVVKRYVGLNRDAPLGLTPLHVVCCLHALGGAEWCPSTAVNVVRLLLDAGADPQAVDCSLSPPLHMVAVARPLSLDLIRLLLDRGAHFDTRNADGDCFLDFVAPEDRAQLNSVQYTTLKCLAARAVKESQIQHQLPSPLADFVKLH